MLTYICCLCKRKLIHDHDDNDNMAMWGCDELRYADMDANSGGMVV